MNGKFIILSFLMASVLSVVFAFTCSLGDASCSFDTQDDIFASFFFIDPATNLGLAGSGSLEVAGNFSDALDEAVSPAPAGAKITEGFSLFLDGLKMVLGLIALLTPIPIIGFILALGFPLYISLFIIVPSFVLWTLAIAELVLGRGIGK